MGGDALDELTALAPRVCSIADARVRDSGGAYVFAAPDPGDLAALAELADRGALRAELSEVFPLEQTAAAHALSEQRSTRGKITIAVA